MAVSMAMYQRGVRSRCAIVSKMAARSMTVVRRRHCPDVRMETDPRLSVEATMGNSVGGTSNVRRPKTNVPASASVGLKSSKTVVMVHQTANAIPLNSKTVVYLRVRPTNVQMSRTTVT